MGESRFKKHKQSPMLQKTGEVKQIDISFAADDPSTEDAFELKPLSTIAFWGSDEAG